MGAPFNFLNLAISWSILYGAHHALAVSGLFSGLPSTGLYMGLKSDFGENCGFLIKLGLKTHVHRPVLNPVYKTEYDEIMLYFVKYRRSRSKRL